MEQLRLCKNDRIYIWKENDFPLKDNQIDQDAPALIPYLNIEEYKDPEENPPVLLIFPGGGFMYKELYKEGEQIAFLGNKLGMRAFVLDYRTVPYTHPCQIKDIQRSIRFIRFNAEKYNINPDKICVIGFSAGGMLAGLAAMEYFEGDAWAVDPVDRVSARPDAAVLCYAVTCLRDIDPIPELLLGAYASKTEICSHYDLISRADDINCPVFCWATCGDKSVSSLHSLELMEQLSRKNKDFELHIYEDGPHGLSLARHNGAAAQWIPSMVKWLSRYGFNLKSYFSC
jgi:acetyl esterase/lipase